MSTVALSLLLLAAVLAAALAYFATRAQRFQRASASASQERDRAAEASRKLALRFQNVMDADAERARVLDQLATERASVAIQIQALGSTLDSLEAGRADAEGRAKQIRAELAALEEKADLVEVGYYEPHFDFDTAQKYRDAVEKGRADQKKMLKDGTAATGPSDWTINGSLREGAKMTKQNLRLMLRAFNGECDAAISNVRFNNINTMEARLNKAFDAINDLNSVNRCSLNRRYLILKLDELHLVHEMAEKVQAEKEEQRQIREQMREEERALREFEQAQKEAEREEVRYATALAKARVNVEAAEGAKRDKLAAQIEELERRLAEAHSAKVRAIARAQLTRSGHVYVISNIGSFGDHVYKIGMTRRLDPFERVKELGDASVPFSFDVHAILYSEDAPALEAALHRAFRLHRVNRVNERKEFFRAPLSEIERVAQEHGAQVEFTRLAEAADFRKTVALLQYEGAEHGAPSQTLLALLHAPATADLPKPQTQPPQISPSQSAWV